MQSYCLNPIRIDRATTSSDEKRALTITAEYLVVAN